MEGWAETNRVARTSELVAFMKFAAKLIQEQRIYKGVLKLENLYYERDFLLNKNKDLCVPYILFPSSDIPVAAEEFLPAYYKQLFLPS